MEVGFYNWRGAPLFESRRSLLLDTARALSAAAETLERLGEIGAPASMQQEQNEIVRRLQFAMLGLTAHPNDGQEGEPPK